MVGGDPINSLVRLVCFCKQVESSERGLEEMECRRIWSCHYEKEYDDG